MYKGKWMPGSKPVNDDYHKLFNCEPCERSFTKFSYYEKHITTELHFKRISRQTCRNYNSDPDFFEQVRSKRRCRIPVFETNHDSNTSSGKTKTLTHIHCPTCYSNVEKRRMGKHLISHFHCQKTSSNDRNVNPEKNLILDNIHEIVMQSPFQCAPCKFYFTQRSQLLNHFATTHLNLNVKTWSRRTSMTGWSCSACRDVLASDGHILMEHLNSPGHLKMEATIGKLIPIILKQVVLQACTLCEKKFQLNRELLSHTKAKHQFNVSKLKEEIENAATLESLNLEATLNSSFILPFSETITSHSNDSSNSSNSDIDFDSELEIHNNTRLKIKKEVVEFIKPPDTFCCEICATGFNSIISLRRHSANAHPSLGGHKCVMCNYSTKKQSHYLRHLTTHSTNRERKFICDECGASFYQKYALNYHKKLHDGKNTSCPFPGCTYMGRSQSEVTNHSVKHVQMGSFVCEKCPYIAKSKRHLKRHNLLQHEPEKSKSFQCKLCVFKTKLSSSLKRHVLKHTGEKPFQCPHCHYATRNIENLRSHVLTRPFHPGKCLYYCHICLKNGVHLEQIFKTNKFCDFQTHVTQNHNENRYSQTRMGLWAVAGIRISEDGANVFPKLPQDELLAKCHEKTIANVSIQR